MLAGISHIGRYANWISIKNAWELTAKDLEAAALGQMLVTCKPSQSLAVVQAESSPPDATPLAITGLRQDLCFV